MTDLSTVPDGYMRDGKGRLVPVSLVKPADQLEDQMVREFIGRAEAMSAEVARFKAAIFEDVGAHLALLAERYGSVRGGGKGNVSFTSFDGQLRVVVAVAEHMSFGPGLQIAKGLIDTCIAEWSADANDKVRILVDHAFRVDKEGQVSREAIFALRRLDIDDPRWREAMAAIADSIRIEGTKSYVRFYRRDPQDKWVPITVDLAAA